MSQGNNQKKEADAARQRWKEWKAKRKTRERGEKQVTKEGVVVAGLQCHCLFPSVSLPPADVCAVPRQEDG